MDTGVIIRVNGPIVEARNMDNTGMLEVVEVGDARLIGEVIRVRGGVATIQVYEQTSGLHPGEPVYCSGRPLSVCLGPGLLGTIYDGIQRPLDKIAQQSGAFIPLGSKTPALDLDRAWHFKPLVKNGLRRRQRFWTSQRRTASSSAAAPTSFCVKRESQASMYSFMPISFTA